MDINPGRLYATSKYTANSPDTQPLKRGKMLRKVRARLFGQLTATSGNNTAANTKLGDEWAVVQRMDLKYGEVQLYSLSGHQLRLVNMFMKRKRPWVTAAIGDGATGNPSFDNSLDLDFEMSDMLVSSDFLLDTSHKDVANFDATVTYGDHTSINASATGFTVNPQIQFFGYEQHTSGSYNGDKNSADFNPYGFGAPLWRRNVTVKTVTLPASGSNQEIDLPTGRYHRALILSVRDSSGIETPGLVTNFQVVRAGVSHLNKVETELWQESFDDRGMSFGYERSLNSGTGGVGRFFQSTKSNQQGNYIIDFAPERRLYQQVNTLSTTEFKLIVDTSATNVTIDIIDLATLPTVLQKAA